MSTKEKKLIRKAQNGDRNAYGKLYDGHVTRIYRFIFLRVRQKADAEDLTQKVFLKAWEGIESYTPRKNVPFKSWLYRIAKNTVIDYYRTNREHLDVDDISDEILSETDEKTHDGLDRDIEFKKVKKALGKLTDNQQNILIMKFIEELSNDEIAEIMGKTEVTVRVTQHRALKRLQEIIEEKSDE